MPIDHGAARVVLDQILAEVERAIVAGARPAMPEDLADQFDAVFASATQAYREVLVGCALARLQDRNIDISLPYAGQGKTAFNGRTLDEKVVNPFLQDNRIPSSRGPYLGVFRRSVKFNESTRAGVRDKPGYDALLHLISFLENASDEAEIGDFLRYLLFKFAHLREAAAVPLARLHRISLERYDALITILLAAPSGGRFPVILIVATFLTIKEFFGLNWVVEHQGINVADAAASAGADITISSGGAIVLAAEVTERPVDRARVVATFNTKIAPNGIEDYLFFIGPGKLHSDVRSQTRQYFAQGHEVNFLEIKEWILMSLATMGKRGRTLFNHSVLELLNEPAVPGLVKVAWNTQVGRLVEG